MGLTQEQGLERDEALKNLKITTYPEGKGYIFISYKSDNWKRVFCHSVFDEVHRRKVRFRFRFRRLGHHYDGGVRWHVQRNIS